MSFQHLWWRFIQCRWISPQTGSLSIPLKPFDNIPNYLPAPKFFDGVLLQKATMPPLFPNKFISSPPTSKKSLSTSCFRAENWVKNVLRKKVMLWIGFTFQEMSSGLWVSFRRRVSSGTSDHFSFSPSLKPQAPQDVSQPNVTDFLPPTFFLSHSIPGWTHSVWSWN